MAHQWQMAEPYRSYPVPGTPGKNPSVRAEIEPLLVPTTPQQIITALGVLPQKDEGVKRWGAGDDYRA